MLISCSAKYFLKVGTKLLWEVKKALKNQIFRFLTENCGQKHWSVCNRFGIIIPSSGAYFLEVGACVLLKAATKIFLKVKRTLKIQIIKLLFQEKQD